MTISPRLVHERNASSSILCNVFGNITSFSKRHPRNASLPIIVIPFDSFMDSIPLQLRKQPSGISVTPLGIISCVMELHSRNGTNVKHTGKRTMKKLFLNFKRSNTPLLSGLVFRLRLYSQEIARLPEKNIILVLLRFVRQEIITSS